MSRLLRTDPDEGWHHVMNRGAGRQDVFHSDRDRRTFLWLLRDAAARHAVEVHAYCLMGNHFHLLVRCPGGGLSALMQLLMSQYVRYLNARLGRDGPIFRSRFHSILLATPDHVDHAGRYIHRNPLDIRPPVALDEYEWSSLRHYVSGRPVPPWLTRDVLIGEHHGVAGYREFVMGDLSVPVPTWDWAIDVAIDEAGDDLRNHPKLKRTIALALLAAPGGSDCEQLAGWFDFPSPEARSMALLRMRRKVAADPLLGQVIRRVHRLAA